MKRTLVVNKYKTHCDTYIGRGSMWGNNWSHIDGTKARYKVSTKEEAIEKYKEWFYEKLGDPWFRKQVLKLRGHRLGCTCAPDICHGDVISEYLNSYNWEDIK